MSIYAETIATSAVTASAVTLLLKFVFDKWLIAFRISREYKYEQRKKAKDIMAKSKINLLNSCEILNHRIWNMYGNIDSGWLNVKKKAYGEEKHYHLTTCYRFLAVFAWIRKLEKEMIFVDTTVSEKDDMSFITYCRLFPRLFCHSKLYDGDKFRYDYSAEKDHFFKENLDIISESIIEGEGIMSYNTFKSKFKELEIVNFLDFFNGINPNETERYRWEIIPVFHLALICFLNEYGYEYQKTSKEKSSVVLNKVRNLRIKDNLKNEVNTNRMYAPKYFRNTLSL